MKKGLFALLLLGFLAISLSSFRPPGGQEDPIKVEYSISENEEINQTNLELFALENPMPLPIDERSPLGGFISEEPLFDIPVSQYKDYRYRWGHIRDYNSTLLNATLKTNTTDNSVTLTKLHRDPGRRGC
jgi:hypothetical protein